MANRRLTRTIPHPFVARIPGSKSYTNRALVIAAMRPGTTEVTGALKSDDTLRLARALDAFEGIEVAETPMGFRVRREGAIGAPGVALDMGGAGTPARFLLAFAAAAPGRTTVRGNARLEERPMDDLIEALRALGIGVECLANPGRLPARITGGAPARCEWTVRGDVSSQFTSALLLLASQQPQPIRLRVEGNVVSRPYVGMTVAMLRSVGIRVETDGEREYRVHPGPISAAEIPVEVDASGMSYFLAAAAVTRTTVRIEGIGGSSAQGDVGLARALERMGCTLRMADSSIELTGGPLRGIEIDMEEMPDVVLTLAAVAARARGTTRITNIANLRLKECDRIHAAAAELGRLGVEVEEGPDWLAIHPGGALGPARIRTYDDHRVAMSFAVLGLVHDPIEIEDPACVGKSFPGFWDELERFCRHHGGGAP